MRSTYLTPDTNRTNSRSRYPIIRLALASLKVAQVANYCFVPSLVPEYAADIGKPDARDRSSSNSDKELIDTASTSCKKSFSCSSYSFEEPSKWRRIRIKMLCMTVAVVLGALTNLKTLSTLGLFRSASARASLAALHEHAAFVSSQADVVEAMLSDAAARSEVELNGQCKKLTVLHIVISIDRENRQAFCSVVPNSFILDAWMDWLA